MSDGSLWVSVAVRVGVDCVGALCASGDPGVGSAWASRLASGSDDRWIGSESADR